MIFDNKINCKYYCENCIYNYTKARQVSNFKVYNIIAKLDILYAHTTKYFNHRLFSERKKLLVTNATRDLQTIAKQIYAYEEALNSFTLQTWPDNKLISLNFPIA